MARCTSARAQAAQKVEVWVKDHGMWKAASVQFTTVGSQPAIFKMLLAAPATLAVENVTAVRPAAVAVAVFVPTVVPVMNFAAAFPLASVTAVAGVTLAPRARDGGGEPPDPRDNAPFISIVDGGLESG